MPLASDFEELIEIAIINNLGKVPFFNLLRYHASMDEMRYHSQALRLVKDPEYRKLCTKRCKILYRRALASAATVKEQERCRQLFNSCLKLCGR